MAELIFEDPKNLVFIQSRAETNYDLVDEYTEMMRSGTEFDAAQGIRNDSGQVFVWDGLHRGEAARLAGTMLLVEVKAGTQQDAEWLALSANQKHGLRRTHKDKQRIVRNALLHPFGASLSDREIARHCGVDHKTVGKTRTELEATGEIPQLDTRRVTKASGETYQIDTRNIGSRPPAASAESLSGYNGRQSSSEPAVASLDEYEPKAQEFECPHCGLEKIVGVNGSRRWCLNCGAEWPTAMAFLAEVESWSHSGPRRSRLENLQRRFMILLAGLDEHQLEMAETWLEDLAREVGAAENPASCFAE